MPDFEAGSIFIAFRSATDALKRGFGRVRSLFARLRVSTKTLQKTMEAASKRIGRAWSRMGVVIGRVMLAAKIALGVATIAAIKWASEGVEAGNKVNVVFGKHAKIIEDFAETSARSFGIARKDALAYAATLGQILKVSGLTEEASAGMSVELLKLAADMASFNDISIEEALTKIQAGLVGEVEPLRRVGVLLSEAALQAKAMELGLISNKNELTDAIKVQARYALILEQTADQQGDFARTSEEFSNSLRIVGAQFKNIGEQLGVFILPILTKGLNKLKDFLDLAPLIIEAVAGIRDMLTDATEGEDLAASLQRGVSAAVDFIISAVGGIGRFLRDNFSEIAVTVWKLVIGIAGPSARKMMRLIFANVKAGLLQIGNLVRFPFDLALQLLLNMGQKFNEQIRVLAAGLIDIIADQLEKLPDFLIPEGSIETLRGVSNALIGSSKKFLANVKEASVVIEEAETKLADFSLGIDENLKAERLEIEAEIDKLAEDLRESGALGEAMDKAGALLRKALEAGSDTFDKALRSAVKAVGLDADEIIRKLTLARNRLAARAATEPSAITGPKGAGGDQAERKTVEAIDKLAKATSAAISTAVADGISEGVLEGKSALSILADVGRRLFKNAFNAAVKSFQTALDLAILQSSIKAKAVLSGILNAAISIVGLLLSQLDRAGDASRRFGKLGAAAKSSQLVQGVVAGPTNVAIAEVGENLKRALTTTEELLRESLIVHIETRDIISRRRGTGVESASTAGNTPSVSP